MGVSFGRCRYRLARICCAPLPTELPGLAAALRTAGAAQPRGAPRPKSPGGSTGASASKPRAARAVSPLAQPLAGAAALAGGALSAERKRQSPLGSVLRSRLRGPVALFLRLQESLRLGPVQAVAGAGIPARPGRKGAVASGRVGIAGHVGQAAAGLGGGGQLERALVVGHRKVGAHATARSAVGSFIPNYFAADAGASGRELGAAAGQGVGAAGREVGVRLPIIYPVARAVVAGGAAHRHAQQRRRLEGLVELVERLRG
nr:hypothetical protein [Tanacetum cinerariifolium]